MRVVERVGAEQGGGQGGGTRSHSLQPMGCVNAPFHEAGPWVHRWHEIRCRCSGSPLSLNLPLRSGMLRLRRSPVKTSLPCATISATFGGAQESQGHTAASAGLQACIGRVAG